jgi:hypothetical protein
VFTLIAGLRLAASRLVLSSPVGAATPKVALFFDGGVVHNLVVPAAIVAIRTGDRRYAESVARDERIPFLVLIDDGAGTRPHWLTR